jgi:FkbM family methyltransferase
MLSFKLDQLSSSDWDMLQLSASQHSRFEIASFSAPNVEYPIFARLGTSDIRNMRQIFCWNEYGFLDGDIKTMLDLGGYVGYASIYVSSRFPGVQVALVEPDRDNYKMALLNCRQYPNIDVINAGVWSKSCSLTLDRKIADEDWGTIMREVVPGEPIDSKATIPALSVSSLIERSGFERVSFLKCDIEGSERELFSKPSTRSWLSLCDIISCELHDHIMPGCSEAFHYACQEAGYIEGRQTGEYAYYKSPITKQA